MLFRNFIKKLTPSNTKLFKIKMNPAAFAAFPASRATKTYPLQGNSTNDSLVVGGVSTIVGNILPDGTFENWDDLMGILFDELDPREQLAGYQFVPNKNGNQLKLFFASTQLKQMFQGKHGPTITLSSNDGSCNTITLSITDPVIVPKSPASSQFGQKSSPNLGHVHFNPQQGKERTQYNAINGGGLFHTNTNNGGVLFPTNGYHVRKSSSNNNNNNVHAGSPPSHLSGGFSFNDNSNSSNNNNNNNNNIQAGLALVNRSPAPKQSKNQTLLNELARLSSEISKLSAEAAVIIAEIQQQEQQAQHAQQANSF